MHLDLTDVRRVRDLITARCVGSAGRREREDAGRCRDFLAQPTPGQYVAGVVLDNGLTWGAGRIRAVFLLDDG